jgi:hypothetical protein
MVVSKRIAASWFYQPSTRATEAKGNSCDNRQAHSWRPRVMMIPLCGGSTALLGITWVCVSRCWQTWRDSVRMPKRLTTAIGSCPSA